MVFIKNVKWILVCNKSDPSASVQGKTFDSSTTYVSRKIVIKKLFSVSIKSVPTSFYRRQKGDQKPNDQLTKKLVFSGCFGQLVIWFMVTLDEMNWAVYVHYTYLDQKLQNFRHIDYFIPTK